MEEEKKLSDEDTASLQTRWGHSFHSRRSQGTHSEAGCSRGTSVNGRQGPHAHRGCTLVEDGKTTKSFLMINKEKQSHRCTFPGAWGGSSSYNYY